MAYAAKLTKASQLGAVIELAKNAGLTINSVLESKAANFPAEGIIVSIGTSKNYGVNWCQVKNQSKIAKKTAIREFSIAEVLNVLDYNGEEVTDLSVTENTVTISGKSNSDFVTVTANNSNSIDFTDLMVAVDNYQDLIA